jgi:hypothetical protein
VTPYSEAALVVAHLAGDTALVALVGRFTGQSLLLRLMMRTRAHHEENSQQARTANHPSQHDFALHPSVQFGNLEGPADPVATESIDAPITRRVARPRAIAHEPETAAVS